MNIKSLRIFLQNVQRNKLLMKLILKSNKNKFDIILIQEISWFIIQQIPSTISEERKNIIEASYYLFWMLSTRNLNIENDYPRVITYVNIKLTKLCFSLCKNISSYWDINLIFFSSYSTVCFLLNIYSDHQQNTLKYLKDTEVNLNNVIIILTSETATKTYYTHIT